MTNNEGLRLYRAGRFADAVQAFRKQVAESDEALVDVAGLGESLLALSQYEDAIAPLSKAGELEKIALVGSMGRDPAVAACLWLSGKRQEGLALMRSVVLGLQQGSISYANDLVGGLKQGLQLRYMAATAADFDTLALSEIFIKRLVDSKKVKNWPGPVGQFLFGVADFEQTLCDAAGVSNLENAMTVAAADLMKRRKLINLLFSAGTAHRIAGRESECAGLLRACASLENPLIELDWYFAKEEAAGSTNQ